MQTPHKCHCWFFFEMIYNHSITNKNVQYSHRDMFLLYVCTCPFCSKYPSKSPFLHKSTISENKIWNYNFLNSLPSHFYIDKIKMIHYPGAAYFLPWPIYIYDLYIYDLFILPLELILISKYYFPPYSLAYIRSQNILSSN